MPSLPNRPLQRRHIEALVAVGDSHSVHRAARELGVPQPVLSRLLAEAENLLGARLFERSSHGSMPTAQGKAVLSQARFVLRAIERLNDAIADPQRRPIQLGCIPRAMHTLMPGLLARLYPAVPMDTTSAQAADTPYQFRVVEGSSKMLFDQIAAGSLDFAILRSTTRDDGDDLVVERLYEERTVIVCAAGHPTIPAGPIHLSRLVGQGWALPDAETSSRVTFETFWNEHGLPRIRPVIETRSFESNLALVAGTSLVSIAPESVARSHVAFGLLRIVKLRRPLPANPVMLAFNRMAIEDPLLSGFREMIHQTARARMSTARAVAEYADHSTALR
ncbi:LysR family transcriptional regulator [Cupriavidus sp. D39]|uniref:LysR family transcriptional regulator n=1 Tax=Cupriavidus sp. D39 TaxID=2997877 RepID=UPI00226E59E1|nr:LysR family transcriptional regulator [Cupriavidus sp. D39]MCY0852674.1 LysR family transcriptional regulator [Cupriavidus sp. D39]